MPECEYCLLAEKGDKIFEDEKVFAVMSPRKAAAGHVLVIPKEHFAILEQVPDFTIGKLFSLANKISTKIFESLNSHGTNIIVENGISAGQKVPHLSINVIPRSENDGMGFAWESEEISEDDMSTAELQLKEHTGDIGGFEKGEKKELKIERKEETLDLDDDNYLIRQLRRIP